MLFFVDSCSLKTALMMIINIHIMKHYSIIFCVKFNGFPLSIFINILLVAQYLFVKSNIYSTANSGITLNIVTLCGTS